MPQLPTNGPTHPNAQCSLEDQLTAPTGLLVSVRCPSEVEPAIAGGAAVIDIKEPANGPLGPASHQKMSEIVAAVGGRVPTTAALGELSAPHFDTHIPTGLAAVKIGLAGVPHPQWHRELTEIRDQLPREVNLGVVGYADFEAAQAPPIESLIEAADRHPFDWLVIDTWSKAGPSSVQRLGKRWLSEHLCELAHANIGTVLAGGLGLSDLKTAIECHPNLVGVRGAACTGGRSGVVAENRVRALNSLVSACRIPR